MELIFLMAAIPNHNARFGSIAAQLFSLSVAPCPLLSNRVLDGAVPRTIFRAH
jgi:hypothetical protein